MIGITVNNDGITVALGYRWGTWGDEVENQSFSFKFDGQSRMASGLDQGDWGWFAERLSGDLKQAIILLAMELAEIFHDWRGDLDEDDDRDLFPDEIVLALVPGTVSLNVRVGEDEHWREMIPYKSSPLEVNHIKMSPGWERLLFAPLVFIGIEGYEAIDHSNLVHDKFMEELDAKTFEEREAARRKRALNIIKPMSAEQTAAMIDLDRRLRDVSEEQEEIYSSIFGKVRKMPRGTGKKG